MNLKDKNIVLGVCGSIAAYKSPLILRELVKAGANVNCVITQSSKEFITEGTLANLSKNPVISDLYDYRLSESGAWHVHLAHKADLVLIAPTSATTIGKLAHGICDNALLTLVLALPKNVPVVLSPAMDYTMWENSIVQENIEKLKSHGYIIIDPEEGELSSGLIGKGRLPEIPVIIDKVNSVLNNE